jgi:hypothetical protein
LPTHGSPPHRPALQYWHREANFTGAERVVADDGGCSTISIVQIETVSKRVEVVVSRRIVAVVLGGVGLQCVAGCGGVGNN